MKLGQTKKVAACRKVKTRGPERLLLLRSQYKQAGIDWALTVDQEKTLTAVLEELPTEVYRRASSRGRTLGVPLSEFGDMARSLEGGTS